MGITINVEEPKETEAKRHEYYVFWCPYCNHKHMINIEDLATDFIDGLNMNCEACDKLFVINE